jgi:hypothetical protein
MKCEFKFWNRPNSTWNNLLTLARRRDTWEVNESNRIKVLPALVRIYSKFQNETDSNIMWNLDPLLGNDREISSYTIVITEK